MNNRFAPQEFFDLSNFKHKEIFENIENVWEALPKLKSYLLKFKSKKPIIGKNTIIKENVIFEGKVIIGDNCTIGPNAYFRENVIIGDNVRIGFSCEIKNSIILNNSKVPHLNYVGDSIIGKNVNLSGGVICGNTRFDFKNIFVRNGDQKINTNLEKFGCLVGDDSNIGINSALNPGTILGKKSTVWPNVLVFGVHKDSETIK